MIPPVEERQIKGCHGCVFDQYHRCILSRKEYEKRSYEFKHGRKKDLTIICRQIPCTYRFVEVELIELMGKDISCSILGFLSKNETFDGEMIS